jgi:hypothetical protein
VLHPRINPRWAGEPCIVAAPGPSLTADVVQRARFKRWIDKWNVIAVNDAYRLMPWADVVYGCDNAWWKVHGQCKGFHGERWACHEQDPNPRELHGNDKRELDAQIGLNLVNGLAGNEFSMRPEYIRYGPNAGFQAINLALLFGCTHIVLVGFDMRHVNCKAHFFGEHPVSLRRTADHEYRAMAQDFEQAAKGLPVGIRILNATPGSALTCFPMVSLDEALRPILRTDGGLRCDRSESHAPADRHCAA